jgi:hypothetical protein
METKRVPRWSSGSDTAWTAASDRWGDVRARRCDFMGEANADRRTALIR